MIEIDRDDEREELIDTPMIHIMIPLRAHAASKIQFIWSPSLKILRPIQCSLISPKPNAAVNMYILYTRDTMCVMCERV